MQTPAKFDTSSTRAGRAIWEQRAKFDKIAALGSYAWDRVVLQRNARILTHSHIESGKELLTCCWHLLRAAIAAARTMLTLSHVHSTLPLAVG